MTIEELLAPLGVDAQEWAEELARQLRGTPRPQPIGLTRTEADLLIGHGGIRCSPDGGSVEQAAMASSASNMAALIRGSLTVKDAAERLAVDPSRVRHRVSDRALYGFKMGSGLRLPLWQFEQHEPPASPTLTAMAHLRAVVAALPDDLHPLAAANFMTLPNPELEIEGRQTSPREWLLAGGDAETVAALARDLTTW